MHGSEDLKRVKPKLKLGDFVRISKYRGKFKHGYSANYTNEVVVVADVLETTAILLTIEQKFEMLIRLLEHFTKKNEVFSNPLMSNKSSKLIYNV